MPTRQFPLEPNGPKRVEVSWTGQWSDFTAKLDGKPLGGWTKDELKAGKEVTLHDGSKFRAHLHRVGLAQELALTCNGKPLPGSSSDPEQLIRGAGLILFLIAGLNALAGVLGLAGVELLRERGIGLPELLVGGIMVVLGLLTMRRSRVALAIAMVLYLADGAFAAWTAIEGHRNVAITVVVHFIFFMALWRGFKAMGDEKRGAAKT